MPARDAAAEARALVARGLESHRAGAVERAESLYREALRLAPSADALHLCGLAAHQRGRHAEAERLIRDAIDRAPPNAAFRNNLGETLRAQGRVKEAVQAYREALAVEPRYPDALGNLALALAGAGRFEEALPWVEQACALARDAFEPHMVRGDLLRRLSRFEEALAAYDVALGLRPDLLAARVNAGMTLLMLDRAADARPYFEAALAIDARSPLACVGLGLALIAVQDLDAAEQSLARALEEAPGYADALVALARLRRAQHRHEEAIECAREALGHDPGVQGAHAVMGSALKSLGRFREAASALEQAAAANPEDAEPLCELASLRDRRTAREALVERIEALLGLPQFAAAERARLHFAAAALRDEGGEHRTAFAHLDSANRHVRASLDFDPGRVRKAVDALIATVDGAFLGERSGWAGDDTTPVFIVGMPRSGTTLTEQMLSMHPAVFGAGEVGIGDMVSAPQHALAAWMERLDAESARDLGARYLRRLCTGAGGACHVSDKMPGNFYYLGLLASLFPEAPLVHCTRSPMDTCLSIYMQHFAQPEAHPYAYELTELGLYYQEYRRLMRHWRAILGPRLHELRYERLVRAPEPELRALLAHCGLDWDPRCLRHTENARAVTTLSAWQARQPVYTSSLARWRSYEAELAPLIEALGDEVGEGGEGGRTPSAR